MATTGGTDDVTELRFSRLPFDTRRIQAHISRGAASIIDFLRKYDEFVQRCTGAPASRRPLSRGDIGVCFTRGGAHPWQVKAVVGNTAFVAATLPEHGATSIAISNKPDASGESRVPNSGSGQDLDVLRDMAAAVSPADVQKMEWPLDLWNWDPDTPIKVGGHTVVVSLLASEWMCATMPQGGSFEWVFRSSGVSVRKLHNAPHAVLTSLFVSHVAYE